MCYSLVIERKLLELYSEKVAGGDVKSFCLQLQIAASVPHKNIVIYEC